VPQHGSYSDSYVGRSVSPGCAGDLGCRGNHPHGGDCGGASAADGLACFNRMYLDVTRQVNSQLGQGFFADPVFMTHLDVAFANLYFAAAHRVAGH